MVKLKCQDSDAMDCDLLIINFMKFDLVRTQILMIRTEMVHFIQILKLYIIVYILTFPIMHLFKPFPWSGYQQEYCISEPPSMLTKRQTCIRPGTGRLITSRSGCSKFVCSSVFLTFIRSIHTCIYLHNFPFHTTSKRIQIRGVTYIPVFK